MSTAALGILLSTVLAAIALSVQIVNMEEGSRARLTTFWAVWGWRALLTSLFVLAAFGIYAFWVAPGVPTRGQILARVVNVLDLLAVPIALFVELLVRAATAQSAKRAGRLDALEKQIGALQAAAPNTIS